MQQLPKGRHMKLPFLTTRTFWLKRTVLRSAVRPAPAVPPGYYILAIATLIFSISVSGQIIPSNDSNVNQKNQIHLNATYFILGTLSDYLGRFYKDYFNSISDQKEILNNAYDRVIKDLMKYEDNELEEMKRDNRQEDLSWFLEIINQQ
jgi:hypothetical protein